MRMSALIQGTSAMAPLLMDAALRGALVLLVALMITHLMRRRTAAARHLVWVGAITIQLLLPLFALWGPRWRVALPDPVANVMPVDLHEAPTSTPDVVNVDVGPSRAIPRDIPTEISAPAPKTETPAANDAHRISGKDVLIALWLLGAAFVLGRLAIGTTIVASLARKGNRVDDGNWLSLAQKLSTNLDIDRPLTLLRGTRMAVPITWGIVYPVVLLPDDADSWPEERRRFVLVHEMAHVKRLDALTQLAGQLALAIFWFNPLVWIANRRMQLEREHACDDYVIRHGTPASQYAEELLSMVQALGTPQQRGAQPAFAALAMARRSEFEGRMLSILDPVLDRHPLSRGRALLSACAAVVLVLPLAALHPYQRTPSKLPAREASSSRTPAGAEVALAESTAKTAKRLEMPMPSGVAAVTRPGLQPFDSAVTALKAGVDRIAAGGTSLTTLAGAMMPQSTAPTTRTASAAAASAGPACDTVKFVGNNDLIWSHVNVNDDHDGSSLIDITRLTGTHCTKAVIVGPVSYSASEEDITSMPFGTHAVFRERTTSDDRELVMSPATDGVTRAYRHNGQSATYDADARRWLAGFLPSVLMDAGVNVGPRVARWRAEGGVDNVLAQIARITSSGAKRYHYQALLEKDDLSGEELDKVVRSASTSMKGSSGDLRAILTRAAPKARLTRQSVSALELALVSMGSSGDKAAVLQAYGSTGDRDMLLMVMRVSESIGSSGDRARLHQVLAPRYLPNDDKTLHGSWFEHAVQIPSSGDLRNTLMIAVPYAASSTDLAQRLIEASRAIASSGDRAAVMISLVSSHAVTTAALRDEFYNAASEIASSGDKARVLQVAANVLK